MKIKLNQIIVENNVFDVDWMENLNQMQKKTISEISLVHHYTEVLDFIYLFFTKDFKHRLSMSQQKGWVYCSLKCNI